MASNGSVTDAAMRTAAQFATTQWSVVLAAGNSASPESQAALEQLCRQYWFPLYAYVRRQGHSPDDAKDLTQEFFRQLLGRHRLRQADRSRGRFRSFLLSALNHFLLNEWDRARAAKRGGGLRFVAWDHLPAVRSGTSLAGDDPCQRNLQSAGPGNRAGAFRIG